MNVSRLVGGAMLGAGLSLATMAGATPFGSGTPEGFVSGLSGASTFGNPDGNPGSLTCPACDSTVNFMVYSNADRSNWTADINASPTFLGGNDPTARWVFLYQIQNTDPLTASEGQLENFNVTAKTATNPYSAGGFINATDLSPFVVPGLDTPNDMAPSVLSALSFGPGADGIDPSRLLFTDVAGPNPISSAAVNAGTTPFAGALFEFATTLIPGGAFSDVLFLTSNARTIDFVWAETESPGGFGAAGDVPGLSEVPLPASLLMLISALSGLGYVGRRRRAVAA